VKSINKIFDEHTVFSKSSTCGYDCKLRNIFFDSLFSLAQSSEFHFGYSFIVDRGESGLNGLFKIFKGAKVSSF
jgi:hypothetical protein